MLGSNPSTSSPIGVTEAYRFYTARVGVRFSHWVHMDMSFKQCAHCKREKYLSDFYRHSDRGYRAECKDCFDLKQKARKFSITVSELEAMYLERDGKCDICQQECSLNRNLSIDHDHSCCPERGTSCGKCIRGLLCNRCNNALGSFRDNPELLERARNYLLYPRGHGNWAG